MRATTALTFAALVLGAAPAAAGPEAHLFRVDARASPTITTVIEVSQPRRIADVTTSCARLTGNAQLDCLGDTLERPLALAAPLAFPAQNALFTVAFGRSDSPLTFESSARWGDSSALPGVGTAWLVLVDASAAAAPRLADAREIAQAFVDSLRPGDVASVVYFDEAGVSLASRWSGDKARASLALGQAPSPDASRGPKKPLAEVIKAAANESYADLFSSGVTAPLHQAMVLLSPGGPGEGSGRAGAAAIRESLARGRFGGSPRMPVPVISVWLPSGSAPPKEARDLMEGVASPDLGGFFTAVRAGRKGRGPSIVSAVRARFDSMVLVRWKLTCSLFGRTQSWKLAFNNTIPPVAGDASFTDAPFNAPPPGPCKK